MTKQHWQLFFWFIIPYGTKLMTATHHILITEQPDNLRDGSVPISRSHRGSWRVRWHHSSASARSRRAAHRRRTGTVDCGRTTAAECSIDICSSMVSGTWPRERGAWWGGGVVDGSLNREAFIFQDFLSQNRVNNSWKIAISEKLLSNLT